MKTKALYLLILAMIAGCASVTPMRYYTLDMTPSAEANPTLNLTVDRMRTAESLARKDIQIAITPTEIEYYAADQWAANLSELVREKLAAEFGPALEDRRTLLLSGLILSFGQVDLPAGGAEGHVRLRLEFSEERYQPALLEKVYEARVPADTPSAPAVVHALSRCLEIIAAQIAEDAAEL
jgi:ABC-type uncharacterized transport system auxiliary subunit